MGRGRKAGQGSGWIARNVREAIYARDGHTCAYCLCGACHAVAVEEVACA